MNRLYLLAYLLTKDRTTAQKCFVRGLDDSLRGNPVFKEWARSWARRMVLQNAIQMVGPRAGSNPAHAVSTQNGRHAMTIPAEIEAIVGLPDFERFAFVMSVLERCSDQECAVLLGCSRADVIAARTRALQQIGSSAELHRKLVGPDVAEQGADKQPQPHNSGPAVKLGNLSQLAATA